MDERDCWDVDEKRYPTGEMSDTYNFLPNVGDPFVHGSLKLTDQDGEAGVWVLSQSESWQRLQLDLLILTASLSVAPFSSLAAMDQQLQVQLLWIIPTGDSGWRSGVGVTECCSTGEARGRGCRR